MESYLFQKFVVVVKKDLCNQKILCSLLSNISASSY